MFLTDSPAVHFAYCVTGFNLVFVLLMIGHGDSSVWQIVAGILIAAAIWRLYYHCAEFRQFAGRTFILTVSGCIWTAAAFAELQVMSQVADDSAALGSIVQGAAIAGFSIVTVIAAIRHLKREEPSGKGKRIAQIAVLGMTVLAAAGLIAADVLILI